MSDDVDLVVRCELDGVMNYKGQDQLLSIKALNEFDPKITGSLAAAGQFSARTLCSGLPLRCQLVAAYMSPLRRKLKDGGCWICTRSFLQALSYFVLLGRHPSCDSRHCNRAGDDIPIILMA